MCFHTCSGTMGIGSSGSTAFGLESLSTTVCASGAVTLVTELRYVDQLTASTSPCSTRLYVKATSAAVNGFPSDHVTPSRTWKVQVRPSADVSQDFASPGRGDMSFIE